MSSRPTGWVRKYLAPRWSDLQDGLVVVADGQDRQLRVLVRRAGRSSAGPWPCPRRGRRRRRSGGRLPDDVEEELVAVALRFEPDEIDPQQQAAEGLAGGIDRVDDRDAVHGASPGRHSVPRLAGRGTGRGSSFSRPAGGRGPDRGSIGSRAGRATAGTISGGSSVRGPAGMPGGRDDRRRPAASRPGGRHRAAGALAGWPHVAHPGRSGPPHSSRRTSRRRRRTGTGWPTGRSCQAALYFLSGNTSRWPRGASRISSKNSSKSSGAAGFEPRQLARGLLAVHRVDQVRGHQDHQFGLRFRVGDGAERRRR